MDLKNFKDYVTETLAAQADALTESELKVGDSIEMAKGRATTGPTFTGVRKIEKVITMSGKAVAYEVKVGPGKVVRVDTDVVQKYKKAEAVADNTTVYEVGTRIEMLPGRKGFDSQRVITKVIRMGGDVVYEVKVGPKPVRVDAKDVRKFVKK